MPVPTLSTQQKLAYNQQRSEANQKLLAGKAANAYQRALQELAFKTDLAAFNWDWDRRRQSIPTSFVARGVLDSGMYHQALQDYAQARLQNLNQLTTRNQLGQFGYTLENRALEDDWARAMYRSYGMEHASKADIAAALRSLL